MPPAPPHDPDPTLLAANQGFYDAFEALDLERMGAVWDPSDAALCIHPGWPALHGWTAIRASWERIFRSTARIQFIVTEVEARSFGDLGWVACVENIVQDATKEVPSSYSSVQATNVFRRDGERWRMVIHHASPMLEGAA